MNSTFFEEYQLLYTSCGSQLKDSIYQRSREVFRQADTARDALLSRTDVERRQGEVRRFITEALGGLPSMETPLNPCITGVLERPSFQVEKIIYQSRPHHYVTASLYLPRQRPARCPAVLFLCGHTDNGRLAANYQRVCQTLAAAGLIVLAQDPLGQGERSEYVDAESGSSQVRHGVYQHAYAGAQCDLIGHNLARYFLHDAMRSIDYLLSRPEVDPTKIGVTGNSGGGVQTALLAMADPRIAAAAPATFIMNRETYQKSGQAQDAEQIWPGFTSAGYDHEDILLAMAPKPFCILAVTADFFCIEGTRRTFERSRRIWELFGAEGEGKLEMVEDVSIHTFTPTLAKAAARFFSRHFFGKETLPDPFDLEPWQEADLISTRTGQVKTDFPDAEFTFDATLAQAGRLAAARRALPAEMRRKQAVDWLRTQVFANREQCPVNPRVINTTQTLEGLNSEIAFWWAAPDVANLGMLFRPRRDTDESKLVGLTIAVWDDGSRALPHHLDWLVRECHGAGRAVLLLHLSTMGPLAADPISPKPLTEIFGTHHKLADDLTWLDDSLAAFHTYELLRVLDVLPLWPGLDVADISLYGHGRYGIFAKLAAALDPRLGPCRWDASFTYGEIVNNRFYNFRDLKSVILPGALRYFDLDELEDAARSQRGECIETGERK